jgi:hypothetical protein
VLQINGSRHQVRFHGKEGSSVRVRHRASSEAPAGGVFAISGRTAATRSRRRANRGHPAAVAGNLRAVTGRLVRCMELGSADSTAAFLRMQERHRLRSRPGGRLHLVEQRASSPIAASRSHPPGEASAKRRAPRRLELVPSERGCSSAHLRSVPRNAGVVCLVRTGIASLNFCAVAVSWPSGSDGVTSGPRRQPWF